MSDTTTTPQQTLAIGVTTDIGSVANALAAVFKMGDAIWETLNSPQMLALRQSQDIQDALAKMDNDLKQAQVTGDISVVDKEASG